MEREKDREEDFTVSFEDYKSNDFRWFWYKYIESIKKEKKVLATTLTNPSHRGYTDIKENDMTDREKVLEIINRKGACSKEPFIWCTKCPLNIGCKFKERPFDETKESNTYVLYNATKWLKDHSEKYTYAEVDLPEWWDGRPIKGYAWDDRQPTRAVGYLIGIIKGNPYPFIVDVEGDSIEYTRYKYFEPITSTPTKVTIEKDGVKREIELTDEQVEALGL